MIHVVCLLSMYLAWVGSLTPDSSTGLVGPLSGNPPSGNSLSDDVDVELAYERVAEQYRERLQFLDRPGEGGEDAVRSLLDQSFVDIQVGLFELRYPAADLTNTKGTRRLQTLCAELVEAQNLWIHWARGTKLRSKGAIPEVDILKRWIKGWKTKGLAKARDLDEPGAVPDLLQADDKTRAALSEFSRYLFEGDCLQLAMTAGEPISMVFTPTRADFVGLACVVGALVDAARQTLWTKTIPQWTEFRWQSLQVLALEYAAPGVTKAADYAEGSAMDAREKTGLEQHVVHHAMVRLCEYYFGEVLDPGVEAGLTTSLVIGLYGENNARAGGSESGNSTAARSKFVAGGQSNGGKFPRINADSTWRAEKGKDHFVRALKKAQESGREGSSDKSRAEAYFELVSALNPGQTMSVRAPFLGTDPGTAGLSTEYVSDSREFFRAYSCAFVDWLRGRKAGQPAAETFAALLRTSATFRATGTSFAEIVKDVYGVSFTAPDRDGESLEWEFLRWLSRR